MIFGNRKHQKNDMDEEYKKYDSEYPEENEFEIEPPMSEIQDEKDRTFTRRGFSRKNVDFGKNSGQSHTSENRSRGLPKHEGAGPLNRTRGKSPFNYESGVSLHRAAKNGRKNKSRKNCKSWGVPWK